MFWSKVVISVMNYTCILAEAFIDIVNLTSPHGHNRYCKMLLSWCCWVKLKLCCTSCTDITRCSYQDLWFIDKSIYVKLFRSFEICLYVNEKLIMWHLNCVCEYVCLRVCYLFHFLVDHTYKYLNLFFNSFIVLKYSFHYMSYIVYW